MRLLVPAVLLVALVLGGAPRGVAGSPAVVVDAFDQGVFDLFDPSDIEVARGGTVRFEFDEGSRSHTATDGTGLDLYDSGVVLPGGPEEVVTFVAAGNYDVICSLHSGMDATVFVPVAVTPSAGGRGTTLTIRWASVTAAGGLVYDVQLRKPGAAWKLWRDGVGAKSGTIVARRVGTWRFRARLVRPATGARSAWSETATAAIA